MQIEYSKSAIKYINASDRLTKGRLKESIEKIPLGDIQEVLPEPDELEALEAGRKDRAVNGTIPHEAINWD